MREEREHAGDAEPNMSEPPPVEAAQAGDRSQLQEQDREDTGAAQSEKREAAPQLPAAVEPETLEIQGTEPIRHREPRGHKRRERCHTCGD